MNTQITDFNMQLAYISRYKNHVPFSQNLNDFIEAWYKEKSQEINFVFVDNDDFDGADIQGTFNRHLERFKQSKTIHIWTGASENTIFGDPKINHFFRCWHDYTHLKYELDYTPLNEIHVCALQMAELDNTMLFERLLINAEITGQILYFNNFNDFPINQRKFAYNFLKTGKLAI